MKLLPFTSYILILAILLIWSAPLSLMALCMTVLGIMVLSLFEYSAHRFAFHNRNIPKKVKRFVTNGHVMHHRNPDSVQNLFIPLRITLPVSLTFLAVAVLFGGIEYGFWFYLGMVIGYFMYEIMHYSAHHYPINLPFFNQMREYHLSHHKSKPNSRFMITTPLWDWIFCTYR